MQRKRNINFNFDKSRRCLHIIPMLSIAGLLLLGTITINPNNNVYATDNNEVEDDNELINDYGLSIHAATASLGIDTSKVEVKVAPGSVGYTSKSITIETVDTTDYTLSITAPTSISNDSSSDSEVGKTTINGADGKTPANMADNTWGYAYGENLTTAEAQAGATYNSFTGSAQTLESGITPSGKAKTLAIAAKFGHNAVSGHYVANITLSLVATPKVAVTHTLTYNANGGDTASIPANQTCTTYNDSCNIPISDTIPTRSEYTFLGWAGSSNATNAEYEAGNSIALSGDKTVWAVWRESSIDTITYMQEMTPEICAKIPNMAGQNYSAEYTLTDNRAYPAGVSRTYTVRKFNDGRCWMTQNLRIYNTTIQASASDFTTPNSITLPNSSASAFIDSRYTYQSYYNTSINTSAGINTTSYYNWYTATAGAGNNTVSTKGESIDASICPKGWKLPTGGSDSSVSEFGVFISKESITNSSKIQNIPYNFKYTGFMKYTDSGSLADGTNSGHWWSSTVNSANGAYYMYVSSSGVGNGNSVDNRNLGYAIRCIARN